MSLKTRLMLATLSGLLLGFSQPFYAHGFVEVKLLEDYFGWLPLIGYVPLFWVLLNQNLKRVFFLSSFTILVQHTVILYWLYIALHVHGHLAPLPASLLTLMAPLVPVMATAPFFVVAQFLAQRYRISFFLLAPVALCAAEYFRNFYFFGGFPWGTVGNSLGRISEIGQLASLVGVYGLVFFAGITNALFCFALKMRRGLGYGLSALGLILLVYLFGVWRLHEADNEFAPTVRVAMLQGNIAQEVKSSARLHSSEIISVYFELVRQAKKEGALLIVWPETAYPKLLDKHVKTLGFDFAYRAASLVGAVAYGDKENGEGYYVHNSAFIIDNNGDVVNRYDKSHLVPFGEYVPWPMSGIVDRVVPGLGAFRPGTEFRPTRLLIDGNKEIKVGTTICYEGLFPEISRAYSKAGADLLVNLTNDAWYGYSSAPFQHLLMYRLRSIESGLPFVRATNTGISAWIDVYGRVHQQTKLFERDLVLADIPLLHKKTLYTLVGDIIPLLCMFFLVIAYIGAVLPVHVFLERREWSKLLIITFFSGLAVASTVYFNRPEFLTDESARTKNFLIFMLCLLLMIGFLSKTKRSRSILLVMGTLLSFVSIALAIFESFYFLLGLILGLLIYLLAFRIKEDDKPIKKK